MAIYKKTKGDTTYYSIKEGVPDKKELQALKVLSARIDKNTYDSLHRDLLDEARDGEPQKPTLDLLESITSTHGLLNPMAQQSMAARQAAAIALLNEEPADSMDSHLDQIRLAAGISWASLRSWCDEKANNAKTGNYLVEPKVLKALDKKVEEVRAAANAKKDSSEDESNAQE